MAQYITNQNGIWSRCSYPVVSMTNQYSYAILPRHYIPNPLEFRLGGQASINHKNSFPPVPPAPQRRPPLLSLPTYKGNGLQPLLLGKRGNGLLPLPSVHQRISIPRPSPVPRKSKGNEKDSVILVVISDGRLANLQESWDKHFCNYSIFHIPEQGKTVRDIEKSAVGSLRNFVNKRKFSDNKKIVVLLMVGYYDILVETSSAQDIMKNLQNLRKAVLQALPPNSLVVFSTVPSVYYESPIRRERMKVFAELSNMILQDHMYTDKKLTQIMRDHSKKKFTFLMKEVEFEKMVKSITAFFTRCTEMVTEDAFKPMEVSTVTFESSNHSHMHNPKPTLAQKTPVSCISHSEGIVAFLTKPAPTCPTPPEQIDPQPDERNKPPAVSDERNKPSASSVPKDMKVVTSQKQPGETKKIIEEDKNKELEITDGGCEIVHVGCKANNKEKTCFLLISDDRIENIRNCWTKFPLFLIVAKKKIVRDLQECVVKALQDLFQKKKLSQNGRLVVMIAAGSHNVLQGCHDVESVFTELFDLKDAVQETLPPGTITIVFPLMRALHNHSRKTMDNGKDTYDDYIRQVNEKIIQYYKPRVPENVLGSLSTCKSIKFNLVLKTEEAKKFVLAFEKCFKHFSSMSVCSFCLSFSSFLTDSYTRGSYCMACDACLRLLCDTDFVSENNNTTNSACHGNCNEPTSLQTEPHQNEIQNALKENVRTMVSLSDAIAGLLVVSFDKELLLLYNKVLKEEDNCFSIMSTFSYNDIARLGMMSERAANTIEFVSEDKKNVLKKALLIIKDNLLLLTDSTGSQ